MTGFLLYIDQHEETGLTEAVTERLTERKAALKSTLCEKHRGYRNAQKRWSAAHHGIQYFSIIASGSAAVILQISPDRTVPAALLAASAAILTALAKGSGFDRKWRANRISRSRTERLLLEPLESEVDLKKVRKSLQDIIQKQDEAIVGEETETYEDIEK